MSLPYENATSGKRAVDEMQKILKEFGCTSFGHMEDFEHETLLVQFQHRGRKVSIKASVAGYAAAWLKHHPYNHRTRGSSADHQRKAKAIAAVAVYSILRDWIKGQTTAVEVGMLSFEGAFLGALVLPNGATVLEEIERRDILKLEGPK